MAPDGALSGLRKQVPASSAAAGIRPQATSKAERAEITRSEAQALEWDLAAAAGRAQVTAALAGFPTERRCEREIWRSRGPAETLLGVLRQRTE